MSDQRLDDLVAHYQRLHEHGNPVTPEQLCADCPELLDTLQGRLRALHALKPADSTTVATVQGLDALPPPPPAAAWPPLPQVPGYEILGELGHGGMGIVYRARQLRANRIVALKMLLPGAAADRELATRFRTEAEAMARLQHPHIVQIYDVGEHQGLPYFSLEYCPGGSLVRPLQEHPLAPAQAARLVQELAQAMQAAHGHGIVHRDLKPANVLLAAEDTEVAQGKDSPQAGILLSAAAGPAPALARFIPKIADFGLAKKLHLQAETLSAGALTLTGMILGTPSYMAPEQAAGKHDTLGPALDIYALGAILYECLTGRPPFKAATVWETLAQVQAHDPVPPRQLQAGVPRDLETICLKCLHKDPPRRYATAADLAEDLRRFQAGEPIAARPITLLERSAKWVRRRPAIAGLSLLVVLVALLGLGGILVNWREAVYQEQQAAQNAGNEKAARIAAQRAEKIAREAEQKARDAAQRAEQNAQNEQAARLQAQKAQADAVAAAEQKARVAEFLTGLFEAADPIGLDGYGLRASYESGQKLSARDLLDRGARKIKSGAKVDPLTEATLLDTIGHVYRNLALFDDAEQLLKAALALRQQHLPPDDPDLASSFHHVGGWYYDRGNLRQAEKYYRKALAIREKVLGPRDPATLSTKMQLAWLLGVKGDFTQSEKLLRELLAIRLEQFPEKSREVAIARLGLAAILLDRGDTTFEVYQLVQKAVQTLAEVEGDKSITLAVGEFQAGVLDQRARKHAQAVAHLRKSLAATLQFLSQDHGYVAAIRFHLALSLEALGELDDAEKTLRACVDTARKTVTLAHPKAFLPVEHFVHLLQQRQRTGEAERLLEEVLGLCRERLDADDVTIAEALDIYASFLRDQGERRRAAAMYAEAVAIFEGNTVYRLDHYYSALVGHAEDLLDAGQSVRAEELLRRALGFESRKIGDPMQRHRLRIGLATALLGQGKHDEAAPWMQKVLALPITNEPAAIQAMLALERSKMFLAGGDWVEAEEHAWEALRVARLHWQREPLQRAVYVRHLAGVLEGGGKHAEAQAMVLRLFALLDGGRAGPRLEAEARLLRSRRL